MAPRPIPPQALRLIKQFEGLRLFAYPDPATKADPWTIGYGHTGPEVKQGLYITALQAEDYLIKDLAKFADKISKAVKVPINDNQYAALLSLVFNIGPTNFQSSTLLRLLNQGDYNGASEQFKRWDRAAGKVLEGLTRRRAAEAKLFSQSL